jgi:competence protein ComEA
MALQTLPGVGPTLARRIVAHRETHGPFRTPADLLHVSGVGAKRYARLHGLIGAAETP